MARLFVERGIPDHLRNGSEMTANVLRKRLAGLGVKTLFITPGSPWENGFCESFNARFRDECLKGEPFDALLEAKVVIDGGGATTTPSVPTPASAGFRRP